VGFPGETERDVDVLTDFLIAARLDVIGVFGYSDEDHTEAASMPGHLPDHEIERRRKHVDGLAETLTAERAADRIGETLDVLVEELEPDVAIGRAAHQGPEVDGVVRVAGAEAEVGSWLRAEVVAADGVDLVAR
jgi:tRNA A37 methylthiotransferase MiaB